MSHHKSSRHSAIPRSRGFTMIEAIAAMVVLAIAVPPMLWSLREAQVQRANATLASQARWLATFPATVIELRSLWRWP